MTLLIINIFLAVAWSGFTGQFTPGNLILGFILGYLILWVSRRAFKPSSYFEKVPQLLGVILYLFWDLVVANIRVAYLILSPLDNLRPRVIAVPLDTCSEIEMTAIANWVSLTPGTLSLDVTEDRCVLYVHSMDAPDPEKVRRDIKEGFERRVLALSRGKEAPDENKETL